jgi:hypothetical protein
MGVMYLAEVRRYCWEVPGWKKLEILREGHDDSAPVRQLSSHECNIQLKGVCFGRVKVWWFERKVPQFRHTSAAHLIPTLVPTAGVVTPAPCSITSPIPAPIY